MKRLSSLLIIIIQVFSWNCASLNIQENKQISKADKVNLSKKDKDALLVKSILKEGKNYFYKERYSEAIEKFEEANSILETEEGYSLLGLSFFKKNEFQMAKNSYLLGLKLNEKNELILNSLALTLTALGDEESVLTVYEKLSEYFPNNLQYSFKRGISLKTLSRHKESYSVLKNINKEEFTLKSQLFIHLGDVCFQLDKFTEANEYYSKANEVSTNLSEIKSSQKKVQVAQDFEKGNQSLEIGNYKEAIRYYSNALKIDPSSKDLHLALGKAFYQNNQLDKAEKSFDSSLDLDPKIREAYSYLAEIYSKNKNIQKSILNHVSAIANFPNDPKLLNELGISYKNSGNINRALIAFIQAKEVDSNYLPARKNLAYTYLKKGQMLEAKREFEDLEELNPKDISIKEKLKEIRRESYEYEKKDISRNKKKLSELKNGRLGSNLKNADHLFEVKKYSEAIIEYAKSFEKHKDSSILIKIFESYNELGQKEKCFAYLKSIWNEGLNNLEIGETIATLYVRLGQETLALKSFSEILEINPESSISYYQLGTLYLSRNRKKSLRSFEKAIAIKEDYASAYIARGINYYKLGNRERAREDFHYALSLESNLEIASYNLGMILFNDNLHADAETIFLDLTKKYPNFADPYYHLGYMYFEQKKIGLAEKYIVSSLQLNRTPTTIYAYIKILEEIMKTRQGDEKLISLAKELRKEIVEKYPNSDYAKKLSEVVLENKENHVVIQKYPLADILVSPPIYINGTLVVNYGKSIARLNSITKSVIWRTETLNSYKLIEANRRVYGLSNTHLEQLDLETGKLLWKVKIDPLSVTRLIANDFVLYSGSRNGREVVYSYFFNGEFQSMLEIEEGSIWEVTNKGNVFVFHDTKESLSWEIYDSKLELVKDGLSLIGLEKGSFSIINSRDTSCYVLKGKNAYRFESNGSFKRSQKILEPISELFLYKGVLHLTTDKNLYAFSINLDSMEKIQMVDKNKSEILIDENTFLSIDGSILKRGKSGKIYWSENLSRLTEKNQSAVFTVFYKR